MEILKMKYRINEQGMIIEYLESQDSSIKKLRTSHSENIDFIASHQSDQNGTVKNPDQRSGFLLRKKPV